MGGNIFNSGLDSSYNYILGLLNANANIDESNLVHKDGTEDISGAKTFWQETSFISTAISSSTGTGAIKVTGGAGIGGNVNIGGQLQALNTSNSTDTSSGSIQTLGGIGIAGNAGRCPTLDPQLALSITE